MDEDGDENRDLGGSVILYSTLRMLADRFVPFREKIGKFFSANQEKSSTDTGRYRSTTETAGTPLHAPSEPYHSAYPASLFFNVSLSQAKTIRQLRKGSKNDIFKKKNRNLEKDVRQAAEKI